MPCGAPKDYRSERPIESSGAPDTKRGGATVAHCSGVEHKVENVGYMVRRQRSCGLGQAAASHILHDGKAGRRAERARQMKSRYAARVRQLAQCERPA